MDADEGRDYLDDCSLTSICHEESFRIWQLCTRRLSMTSAQALDSGYLKLVDRIYIEQKKNKSTDTQD